MKSDEGQHNLNLLAALAEDRLDSEERGRLTQHLAECPDCRETFATLARAMMADGLAAGRRKIASILARPRVWLPMAAALVVATGLVLRLTTPAPSPGTQPAGPDERAVVPPPSSSPAAQTPVQPRAGDTVPATVPRADGGLLARRGAERKVAGKTFRLIAGEWIDTAYDRFAGLRVVDVRTADERAGLLLQIPALTPYSKLGSRVTVVLDEVVYRFDSAPPQ